MDVDLKGATELRPGVWLLSDGRLWFESGEAARRAGYRGPLLQEVERHFLGRDTPMVTELKT